MNTSTHFSKALNEPDDDEGDFAIFSGYGDEEAEQGIDEHSPSEEPFRSVFLGQNTAGDLSDAVAVEKGA